MKGRIGGDEVVCIVGLGYVKLFLQAKTFTKKLFFFIKETCAREIK